MLYCDLNCSNSIQLKVWVHETSAQNTGFNTGKHRCGYAVSAALVLLGSAWHWHKAGFWKDPRKERWGLYTISTKVFLALKEFYGRININKSQQKREDRSELI